MIVFKIILALVAAKIAKLLGSHPGMGLLIGGFFGHFLDILAHKKIMEWKYRTYHSKRLKAQADADFLFCFFTLAGRICLADGAFVPSEKEMMKKVINERLKLKRKDRKLAQKYFDKAASQQVTVQTLASKLVELFRGDPTSLKNTVLMLRELAEADGSIDDEEYKILFTVSSVLGFDPSLSEQLLRGAPRNSTSESSSQKSQNRKEKKSPLEQAYSTLGCKPGDPRTKLKQSYREMASKYHPDKILGKDLPQDFIDFAHQKFRNIQEAYDLVREAEGF